MRSDPEPPPGGLVTEQVNSESAGIDRLSAAEIVALMNREDASVIAAVNEVLPAVAHAVEAVADRLRRGGRLIYVGAGTSGRLGVLDASECPPTFNTPPEMVVGLVAGGDRALREAVEAVEDSPGAGAEDIERLEPGPRDAVVGIAASGHTPYVLGAVRAAGRRGALTIGIACNPGAPLERLVDIAIVPVVGPEIIAGSTRLKAGTATKMILNMISTGAMVRLGKTYGNLMVDLRATNAKLRDRSIRILQSLTGFDRPNAIAQLEAANGELKTAIVTALTGISPQEGRERLRECEGILRRVLERR